MVCSPLVEGGPEGLPYELGPETDGWCWGGGGPSAQATIPVQVSDTPTKLEITIMYITLCLLHVINADISVVYVVQ